MRPDETIQILTPFAQYGVIGLMALMLVLGTAAFALIGNWFGKKFLVSLDVNFERVTVALADIKKAFIEESKSTRIMFYKELRLLEAKLEMIDRNQQLLMGKVMGVPFAVEASAPPKFPHQGRPKTNHSTDKLHEKEDWQEDKDEPEKSESLQTDHD